MSGIALQGTADFDGIANAGWIDTGDWLQYNIDVADTNSYFLYLRIAAVASTSLDKGKAKLKLNANSGNFNINWLRISTKDNTAPSCSAGDDQEIILPADSIILVGEGNDMDGDTLEYKWIKVSGAGCNISGALIFSKALNSEFEKIYVSGFARGVYLVKVKQDSAVYVGKVVLN